MDMENKESFKTDPKHTEMMLRLSRLSLKGIFGINNEKPTLEPVMGIYPNGEKIYMERIIGTCKYLSHRRKFIYDLAFVDLYVHNGKIPPFHFAIENYLYLIEASATTDNPDKFIEVMDSTVPEAMGACIYLDNELYMSNLPFKKSDVVRNLLLQERRDGTKWFEVLRVVDPSGNKTDFLPSPAVKKRHEEACK